MSASSPAAEAAITDDDVGCIILSARQAADAFQVSQSLLRLRWRDATLARVDISPGRAGLLISDAAVLFGPVERTGLDDIRELFADEDFIRPSTLARKIGASTRTVERLIVRGELPAKRVGGYTLLAVSDCRAWLVARRRPCRWEVTK